MGTCDADPDPTDPDPTFRIITSRKITVDDVLGMCYDSDFGLSVDKSSCDEGEKVHASYCGQRVIQPEEVAALFRAVISDQACSSARLVQDCDSSADEVNQGNSEGE